MNVLVDSSVWIDYFRDAGHADLLTLLIEEDAVVVNDLILAEILPLLFVKKETELVMLLREVRRQPMNIDWEEITRLQVLCLKKDINGVGIPDILIAQNAIQGNMRLLSNDRHFRLLSKYAPLKLYEL